MTGFAAVVFGMAAAIFLGRFELRSDDAGVEVFFVLLFTLILGCWCPKRAWVASLLGLSIPVAELIWGQPRPSLSHPAGLAMLAGFMLVLGVVGSYSGAFIRRFLIGKAPG